MSFDVFFSFHDFYLNAFLCISVSQKGKKMLLFYHFSFGSYVFFLVLVFHP